MENSEEARRLARMRTLFASMGVSGVLVSLSLAGGSSPVWGIQRQWLCIGVAAVGAAISYGLVRIFRSRVRRYEEPKRSLFAVPWAVALALAIWAGMRVLDQQDAAIALAALSGAYCQGPCGLGRFSRESSQFPGGIPQIEKTAVIKGHRAASDLDSQRLDDRS